MKKNKSEWRQASPNRPTSVDGVDEVTTELYLCSTTDFTLDRYDRDDQLLHAKKCEDTFRCDGWTGLVAGNCEEELVLEGHWVEMLLRREELV